MDSGIKELQEGLQKLATDSSHVNNVTKRLEAILSQLDCPISRQVTQLSELHDSLTSERIEYDTALRLIPS